MSVNQYLSKLQQENYKKISIKSSITAIIINSENAGVQSRTSASLHSKSRLSPIGYLNYLQPISKTSLLQSIDKSSQIKASKPTYFEVTPCVGLLLSQKTIKIDIVTRHINTPQLVHDISYQNKFLVQYALLNRIPSSIQEGLSMITDQNKQKQKLFVATEYKTHTTPESYSGISNKYSYRSTFNNNRSQVLQRNNKNRLQRQDVMNEQQKIEHLNYQIDKLEIQRAHLVASSKPHPGLNLVRLLIILVICILTGYFAGKSLFGKSKITKKQKQYGWFGLEKYFIKQEQPQPWWIFWK